jgi:hypothetical protein
MEDTPWANGMLKEAGYRAEGLRHALATQRLHEPGSAARNAFIEQCLTELDAIEGDIQAAEQAAGTGPDTAAAGRAIGRGRARIAQFAGPVDPPGVHAEMTWVEGFRQLDIASLVTALVDEITQHVRPGTDNPLEAVFRKDGPYVAAHAFAQTELASRTEALIGMANQFAEHAGLETMASRYPGFVYKTEDPPPEFHLLVRELIQQLAPVLFPMDAGYVDGDLFRLLGGVYSRAVQSLGVDLGAAAARLTLVDLLFLRGQLSRLAGYAAGLPRGTVAGELLVRTAAILMTAAHRSGPGKIPAGYQKELDALQFYVDAFMTSMLGRLAAADSQI